MWPFGRKRRLESDHADAWLAVESCPRGFANHPDPVVRDHWFNRQGEIRRTLFDRHLQSLSAGEREQLLTGTHPSQSWERAAEAAPWVDKLSELLRQRGYHAKVTLGLYHGDRIVLSAELPAEIPELELWTLPGYFLGFEVKYSIRPTAK